MQMKAKTCSTFSSRIHSPRMLPAAEMENVVNVFKCNMVDGEPTSTNYIALETADGKRYLVAACAKTGREFDNVLMQLKSMANGGRQW